MKDSYECVTVIMVCVDESDVEAYTGDEPETKLISRVVLVAHHSYV